MPQRGCQVDETWAKARGRTISSNRGIGRRVTNHGGAGLVSSQDVRCSLYIGPGTPLTSLTPPVKREPSDPGLSVASSVGSRNR